jgi:hypothetical protein
MYAEAEAPERSNQACKFKGVEPDKVGPTSLFRGLRWNTYHWTCPASMLIDYTGHSTYCSEKAQGKLKPIKIVLIAYNSFKTYI